MDIKKKSPFKQTFIASLAMDSIGYIPLRECFARGGYEVLPIQNGGAKEDTADLLIKESLKLLNC